MAAQKGVTQLSTLLLGTCLPCLRHNASKIKVQQLDFDPDILWYFKKYVYLYAYDPEKIAKTGDIVLLKLLPQNKSTSITHEVLKVVYPCGDITDPITGKNVVLKKYRDEIEFEESLYGKVNSTFNYKKAPRRGWQEEKRDFSHRPVYRKYHEFDEGEEYHDQPHSSPF